MALAAQVEVELVGVRVPVQLLHLAGLDDHQAARHGLGDRPLVDRGEAESAALEVAPRPDIRAAG